MSDVPRPIERRVNSAANVRGLDVLRIELEEENEDGSVYRVVIHDEDAEEGENPAFFVLDPNDPAGGNMFGERLDRKISAVRKKILGVRDETDQELEQTRQQLEESGHPGATDEEVEYGPGPRPNVQAAMGGGYDDGQISVRSITDAEIPEVEEPAQVEDTDTDQMARDPTAETTQQDTGGSTTDMTEINTDDLFGKIADASLDARDLEAKGHDMAAEALLQEIRGEIDDYLEEEDA